MNCRSAVPFIFASVLFLTATTIVAQVPSTPSTTATSNAPLFQQQAEPQPPFPALSADHQQYVERILEIWEESSGKIKTLKCNFRRFDYDNSLCNWRDPRDNRLAAAAVVEGEIRYQGPDQARYDAAKAWDFAGPPEAEGQDPQYKPRDQELAQERWICDGKSTYEFDFVNKRLYETGIPTEFQGQGLANSPMPFLFGANKKQILERYWVRTITPPNVKNEYWLEVTPKRKNDASSYSKVEIYLSNTDFLPNAIHVYSVNYDPKENQFGSRYFQFADRQINGNNLQAFLGLFVRPNTPIGWTRVDADTAAASASSENSLDMEIEQNLRGTDPSIRK